jgi:hypothetical protein
MRPAMARVFALLTASYWRSRGSAAARDSAWEVALPETNPLLRNPNCTASEVWTVGRSGLVAASLLPQMAMIKLIHYRNDTTPKRFFRILLNFSAACDLAGGEIQ